VTNRFARVCSCPLSDGGENRGRHWQSLKFLIVREEDVLGVVASAEKQEVAA
jgi:hypothetical protein